MLLLGLHRWEGPGCPLKTQSRKCRVQGFCYTNDLNTKQMPNTQTIDVYLLCVSSVFIILRHCN